jgi:hypothetical protein
MGRDVIQLASYCYPTMRVDVDQSAATFFYFGTRPQFDFNASFDLLAPSELQQQSAKYSLTHVPGSI